MSFNIITLPVILLFVANGLAQLYYALKLKKKFPNEHNIKNSFIAFFLWSFAGLLYPFFYSTDNSNIRFFQAISTFFICIFTPILLFFILYYQYRLVKKNPSLKEKREIKAFLKEYDEKNRNLEVTKTYTLKTDLHRKFLHLFAAGIIIILWYFAVYIWDGLWRGSQVWGISGADFGRFLILTAGYSGILVFAALDYVRLSYIFENRNLYHLLPDNVLNLLTKAMKRKELFEFLKPVSMVLALVPAFFLPFGIFCAIALIATVGDGAASLIGESIGRHRFPKKSGKTIEGYIAGFLASFGIGFLSIFLFEIDLNFNKIIIIAFSGALTFFVIDFVNLDLDDNMLNPLFCVLIMSLLYYLL